MVEHGMQCFLSDGAQAAMVELILVLSDCTVGDGFCKRNALVLNGSRHGASRVQSKRLQWRIIIILVPWSMVKEEASILPSVRVFCEK